MSNSQHKIKTNCNLKVNKMSGKKKGMNQLERLNEFLVLNLFPLVSQNDEVDARSC